MVAIILGYYAAWPALAIPVLTWRARRLFVLAGLTAVIGPVLVQGVPWALHDYGFPENIVLVPDVRESDAIGWEPLVDSLTDS